MNSGTGKLAFENIPIVPAAQLRKKLTAAEKKIG
jgi:hypothetical protein